MWDILIRERSPSSLLLGQHEQNAVKKRGQETDQGTLVGQIISEVKLLLVLVRSHSCKKDYQGLE